MILTKKKMKYKALDEVNKILQAWNTEEEEETEKGS